METSGGGGVSLGGLLLRLDAGATRRVELAGGEKDWAVAATTFAIGIVILTLAGSLSIIL